MNHAAKRSIMMLEKIARNEVRVDRPFVCEGLMRQTPAKVLRSKGPSKYTMAYALKYMFENFTLEMLIRNVTHQTWYMGNPKKSLLLGDDSRTDHVVNIDAQEDPDFPEGAREFSCWMGHRFIHSDEDRSENSWEMWVDIIYLCGIPIIDNSLPESVGYQEDIQRYTEYMGIDEYLYFAMSHQQFNCFVQLEEPFTRSIKDELDEYGEIQFPVQC